MALEHTEYKTKVKGARTLESEVLDLSLAEQPLKLLLPHFLPNLS